MSWVLYKNNVAEILSKRLGNNQYPNSENILLDGIFANNLLAYFPKNNTYLAEYVVESDYVIACLLVNKGFGRWDSYMPGQSPLSFTYVDASVDKKVISSAMKELFKILPKVALRVTFLRQDPDLANKEIYSDFKASVFTNCALNTSIPLENGFEEYWSSRSKKVRKEITRKLTKVEKSESNVSLKIVTDESDIEEAVKQYGDLESSGWKGKEGSAINESNTQGKFYKKLLLENAKLQRSAIFNLLFDEKIVASLLTIFNSKMIVVLKTTYDESLSNLSPGRLIDYFMIREVAESNLADTIENFTNASESDKKWCTRYRDMYHVEFYRWGWLTFITKK